MGLRPLQVGHVPIGKVGDEAAVREPAPQKVHHLAAEPREKWPPTRGERSGKEGWLAAFPLCPPPRWVLEKEGAGALPLLRAGAAAAAANAAASPLVPPSRL